MVCQWDVPEAVALVAGADVGCLGGGGFIVGFHVDMVFCEDDVGTGVAKLSEGEERLFEGGEYCGGSGLGG